MLTPLKGEPTKQLDGLLVWHSRGVARDCCTRYVRVSMQQVVASDDSTSQARTVALSHDLASSDRGQLCDAEQPIPISQSWVGAIQTLVLHIQWSVWGLW